jgi:hypothetical protein
VWLARENELAAHLMTSSLRKMLRDWLQHHRRWRWLARFF